MTRLDPVLHLAFLAVVLVLAYVTTWSLQVWVLIYLVGSALLAAVLAAARPDSGG